MDETPVDLALRIINFESSHDFESSHPRTRTKEKMNQMIEIFALLRIAGGKKVELL